MQKNKAHKPSDPMIDSLVTRTQRLPKCCLFLESKQNNYNGPQKRKKSMVKAARQRMLWTAFIIDFSRVLRSISVALFGFKEETAFRDPSRSRAHLISDAMVKNRLSP